MNKKIKGFAKKYLIGFILGMLSAGIVAVSATTYFPSNQTTYDNSESGMQATNVQGAIDELYNTCFPPTAGDSILDKEPIVTTGDGLYEDEYEEGKYTYKGANPNNYVTFNNETAGWRIISINSDGTIKIMRNASIDNRAWDTSGSNGNNNWNYPASLNTYLNGIYYNSLTSTAQSQIVESSYYSGGVTEDNNDMQDQINDEKSTVSNVKVALPTVSEYIRAGSNTSCKTLSTYNSNSDTCKNSDWMFTSDYSYWWTLSPVSGNTIRVFYVYFNGDVDRSYNANNPTRAVRPVVTLSSSVKITGTGTQSDPYIIE